MINTSTDVPLNRQLERALERIEEATSDPNTGPNPATQQALTHCRLNIEGKEYLQAAKIMTDIVTCCQ
jgi:hypothetical protein